MNVLPSDLSAANPAHALSGQHVSDELGGSPEGLSDEDIAQRRDRYGWNELAEAPASPWWKLLARQFGELMIGVLAAAAIISAAVGEWVDGAVILAIVIVNGVLGYVQEERAGRALAALRKLTSPQARVVRGGAARHVAARDLVPGDHVELEAGDRVLADVRLLESVSLRIDEASLTGESIPADKDARIVLPSSTPLGDRRNMAYMGTVVTAGKGSAVVTNTAMTTELGRIAGLLRRETPQPTPLQRRLAAFGKALIGVCLAIVTVIFTLHVLRGSSLTEAFVLAVSLAVAAVPEGLPAVVTIVLALGVSRMARRHALVRNLASVETLGSVSIICSDKTGTLTQKQMTVREMFAGGARYRVTGSGYTPEGQFLEIVEGSSESRAVAPEQEHMLLAALTICLRCNHASITRGSESGSPWEVIGDPTEGALVVAARKAGIDRSPAQTVFEIPFDSERKRMSVVQHHEGLLTMYTKGAPEMVLGCCTAELVDGASIPLTDERLPRLLWTATEMASRGLRVVALAYRDGPGGEGGTYLEEDLVFAGLAGMTDPPREEVRDAVARCAQSGISAVMITGDHPETAMAVAQELGITRAGDRALSGSELDRLDDQELAAQVGDVRVFARVSPEHKLRIVRAWKSRGNVVAMTGDGVNDAPAVRAADVGIAMGIAGTDVTREASDMVLADDNFATIVQAVEEGRGIFDNIQKFVHYLLSCNAGEVLFVFFGALAGWPVPLTAIQILWINLVTDGLPALALGVEKPEPDAMRRPPRPPGEPLISWRLGLLIVAEGASIAAVTAIGFLLVYRGDEGNLDRARTVAFCTLSYSQLFYAFACRSRRYTLPQLGLFTNRVFIGAIVISGLLQLSAVVLPFAAGIFKTTPQLGWGWVLVLILSLIPATVVEVAKILLHAVRGAPR